MRGRPFRIAAAGLCTAFLWSIVAAVSHFDAESKGLTLNAPARRYDVPRVELAVATPPATNAIPVPAPSDAEPSAVELAVVASQPATTRESATLAVALPPVAPEPPETSLFRMTASRANRKKEFMELPPPPDFPEVDLFVESVSATTGEETSSLIAELTSLRREFAQWREDNSIQREPASDAASLRTTEQLQAALVELRHCVEQLRADPPLRRDDVSGGPNLPPPAEAPIDAVVVTPAEPHLPIAIRASRLKGCYDIEIEGAPLSSVLAAIGRVGGWNIVASPLVEGTVAGVWRDVTPQQALEALLKTHRLVSERQAAFVVVSTSAEVEARESAARSVQVQLYRLEYVSGGDLLPLIEPLLTAGVGQAGVTGPSRGKKTDPGNGTSRPDALLVIDYPEVIEMVGRAVAELDRVEPGHSGNRSFPDEELVAPHSASRGTPFLR